jgi:hypothetical protein
VIQLLLLLLIQQQARQQPGQQVLGMHTLQMRYPAATHAACQLPLLVCWLQQAAAALAAAATAEVPGCRTAAAG